MILPTMAINREVLLAIPKGLQWLNVLGAETIFWRAVTSRCFWYFRREIAFRTSCGETMAVTMVIGNSPIISVSLLDLGYTIQAVHWQMNLAKR